MLYKPWDKHLHANGSEKSAILYYVLYFIISLLSQEDRDIQLSSI